MRAEVIVYVIGRKWKLVSRLRPTNIPAHIHIAFCLNHSQQNTYTLFTKIFSTWYSYLLVWTNLVVIQGKRDLLEGKFSISCCSLNSQCSMNKFDKNIFFVGVFFLLLFILYVLYLFVFIYIYLYPRFIYIYCIRFVFVCWTLYLFYCFPICIYIYIILFVLFVFSPSDKITSSIV